MNAGELQARKSMNACLKIKKRAAKRANKHLLNKSFPLYDEGFTEPSNQTRVSAELSISISGGKETNMDSPSNGE
ncbi:1908_t:CDS:2 [Paraglomus occultum]|uniref:1908_t:CDS:1 n=1 Tax=Paraglomus occultum TaxID=144539 RepID=A0A9N8WSW4_9GLOM|nr:1908_t:CDS:2 [Paraglomus occultum]